MLPVDERTYQGLRSPTSIAAWLAATETVLATSAGETHRRRISMSRKTFLKAIRAEAQFANRHTGRGVATSHETLARALGMSVSTARRARDLMIALDCAVRVVTGRYLTVQERLQATAHHGGVQLRAASVRALTIPKNMAEVTNEHLTTASRFNPAAHQLKNSPRRGKPHSEAASRPQPQRKRAKFEAEPIQPRPLPLQKLAAALVYEIPWLPRDLSVLRVQRIIYRSGFDAERFRYADLLTVWERLDSELHQTPKNAGDVKDPEAYLASRMKLAAVYARYFQFIPGHETARAAQDAAAARTAQQAAARAADRLLRAENAPQPTSTGL
ncbi:hypothetical protein AX769_21730 (plasmid) [Frondihabitans sp. PAMC 28766]|uniref:hypothetical protein n=1 Tax=Frondihabitans sp. PAMC 28766 TaxID=1795630 RepID=UPI00078D03B8|nr:hypothetical protein [Frondihabitans sp. PAMC 28766]AMM22763.1 hypothetical protein AX769_21730 [Frondihabitans sp. PAMC 28766]